MFDLATGAPISSDVSIKGPHPDLESDFTIFCDVISEASPSSADDSGLTFLGGAAVKRPLQPPQRGIKEQNGLRTPLPAPEAATGRDPKQDSPDQEVHEKDDFRRHQRIFALGWPPRQVVLPRSPPFGVPLPYKSADPRQPEATSLQRAEKLSEPAWNRPRT